MELKGLSEHNDERQAYWAQKREGGNGLECPGCSGELRDTIPSKTTRRGDDGIRWLEITCDCGFVGERIY